MCSGLAGRIGEQALAADLKETLNLSAPHFLPLPNGADSISLLPASQR